ncbi:MAG: alpha/beta hydrolase-fold protein [Terriglobales bacterium]
MSKLFVAISLGFLLGCCVPVPAEAQQGTDQPLLHSPRLVTLEKQLKSGDAAALDNFWREVKQQGTPLVEPIPGDDQRVLVTFLWHAKTPIKNVVLVDGPAADDYPNNELTHLEGTELWYRTYRIRSDARFYYSFSVNDPLTFPTTDEEQAQRSPQPDPLSRHIITTPKDEDDPNDKEETGSALELPGAPSQPWVAARPGVSAGAVALHRFKSALLNNERRVWVYTPPGYSTKANPYGLLVLFMGWDYVHVIPTPTILDNLYAEKRIPPLVAVFVAQPLALDIWARYRELQMNDDFASFVARELVPWIHEHYNITPDPARTIVGGVSAGGRAAAFVALRHPGIFGNVLSQSGAFQNVLSPNQLDLAPAERWNGEHWGEYLTHEYAAAPKAPVRFYLEAGIYDLASFPKGPSVLLANRHLRDVLQAKGYTFRYSEFPGDHSELYWKGMLADGLTFLIGSLGNDNDVNR